MVSVTVFFPVLPFCISNLRAIAEDQNFGSARKAPKPLVPVNSSSGTRFDAIPPHVVIGLPFVSPNGLLVLFRQNAASGLIVATV